MTGHTCPVDGCDYGEQADKSKAAVRAHINATGDDAHDWQDLKAEVTGSNDDPEPAGEQTEASESSGSDTTEETSDDGARTSRTGSDYEEQLQAAADSGGDGSDDGADDGAGDGSDDGGSGGVSTGALIAGTATLAVAYLLTAGDSDDGATPATDAEANSAASSTDSDGMSPSAIK